MIVGAVGLVILGAVKGDPFPLVVGLVVLVQGVLFLYVTTRGKHRVWAMLLDDLDLAGDESVLDIGCGRGAVTIAVAERLPSRNRRGHRPLAEQGPEWQRPATSPYATPEPPESRPGCVSTPAT